MTNIERHQAVREARLILMEKAASMPSESPVYKFLCSAYRELAAQMVALEQIIAAHEDTAGECAECGAQLLDITTHDDWDCPASPDFPWPNESQRIGLPN